MSDALAQRLRRIKLTIAEQGFTMNPCLTEEEVARFEERHKVRLPEEYRLFLMTVGNGGKGPPLYGLPRLGEVPSDYRKSAAEVLSDITKPFR
jgi:hypothetical protein